MTYLTFLKRSRIASSTEEAIDCLNEFSLLSREERERFVKDYKSRVNRLVDLANQDIDDVIYYLDEEDFDFYTD